MAEVNSDNLRVLIPRLLVLAGLLLVLLFILTKFNFLHCAQAPYPWCEMYCSVAKSAKIAIITGENGIGNASLMLDKLSSIKPSSPIDIFRRNEISKDVITSYEMVVLTQAKTLDLNQQEVIRQYLEQPQATLLWIGDSGSIQEECIACKIKSNSIAIVYSKGPQEADANALRNELIVTNPNSNINLVEADSLTVEKIKDVDVLIYESFVSLNAEADKALKQYLAAGKKYHVLQSFKNFKTVASGFGTLGRITGVDFIQTKKVKRNQLQLLPVRGTDYTIVKGLRDVVYLSAANSSILEKPSVNSPYPEYADIAIVTANPTSARVLSKWKIQEGNEIKEYDAIVQSNYFGSAKIIYIAFPIEKSELKWLLEETTKYLAWC